MTDIEHAVELAHECAGEGFGLASYDEAFIVISQLARAVLALDEKYTTDVRVLLESNAAMVQAVNEAPEFLEAVKVACTQEGAMVDKLRAALKEALDSLEDVWENEGRCAMERPRLQALRKEFGLE